MSNKIKILVSVILFLFITAQSSLLLGIEKYNIETLAPSHRIINSRGRSDSDSTERVYEKNVWRPNILSFELTRTCDNPELCRICASGSTHNSKSRLTREQVFARLREAKEAGIQYFGVTGGEPTLEEETLFAAIEEGERCGVRFNYINTNCYKWGQTVDLAKEKLTRIAKLKNDTWEQDHTVISIGVGDEHRGIPIERTANFIEAYQEVFPGSTLEANGLRLIEKDQTIEKLIVELTRRGLINDVTRNPQDNDRVTEIILNNDTRISIFYNYVVPISRAISVDPSEYEHFNLTDDHLKRPISRVPTREGMQQVIVIGWDNKASPDIVFKCTNTLVIPDSDKKTVSEIIAEGNQDPLLRAGVESIWRILEAAKNCGYGDLIKKLRKKHSTIHGLIAEIILDPERKMEMRHHISETNSVGQQILPNDHFHPVGELQTEQAPHITSCL